MQRNKTKRRLLNAFWLSLLLHIIILAIIFLIVQNEPERRTAPDHTVSAYTYQERPSPTIQQRRQTQSKQTKSNLTEQKTMAEKQKEKVTVKQSKTLADKEGIKPPAQKSTTHETPSPQKSMIAASFAMLREQQMQKMSEAAYENVDPIYLVGDPNMPADGFSLLLGKALSAHFEYPKLAGEMGIRGRVIIGLTLHPEGYFSDVEILQSSHHRDLDAAALYAVNQAPTIEGMNKFLSKPKHFVVGFIFN